MVWKYPENFCLYPDHDHVSKGTINREWTMELDFIAPTYRAPIFDSSKNTQRIFDTHNDRAQTQDPGASMKTAIMQNS